MRGTIDDPSLGAGNVPFWLRDHDADLNNPRLLLDCAWVAPDGPSRSSLSLMDMLMDIAVHRQMYYELGVCSGDVVVVHIKSPVDVYLHWMALAANGVIAALVNPNLSTEAVRDYGHRIGAVGELTDAPAGEASTSEKTGPWWHSSSKGTSSSPVPLTRRPELAFRGPEHEHRPDDIVLLCHTSGTTGYPKPVSCSHHGFMVGIRSQMRHSARPLSASTILNALPAAHHSWLMTITWALLSGTKLILASDQSARTLVQDIERFEPDSIRSFSCTLREVARLNLPPEALRSVALWVTTGDASRRHDIATVSALGTHPVVGPGGVSRAPGMFVLDGLGSTELGHLHFSVLHTPGRIQEARCIGRPASFATASVLDDNGEQLPDGQVGYLAVRSDAVTPGYWNDPQRTAASRRGSFWITGDVGYRDAYGRYFHLDRLSDVIETPSGPVYSVRTEEELLRSIPEIVRCAVLGLSYEDGVVRPVCLIESDDHTRDKSAWHQEVNAVLAKASLAPVADIVILAPGTLPLGPTGKIRKYLARGQLAASATPLHRVSQFHSTG
jgi:acyl-coenzyme A synthetase/AMP-(fatty) acid ligase